MLKDLVVGIFRLFLEDTSLPFIDTEGTIVIFGFDIDKTEGFLSNFLLLVGELIFSGHDLSERLIIVFLWLFITFVKLL